MIILITGKTGQIGSALAKTLEPLGTIVTVGRSELDLAQPDRIGSALDRIAPDLIVNAAAYTAVDAAERERDTAFCVNAESPRAMASWAASRRVPLIHFSTDYVFNGEGTRPWREDDPTNPLSTYGASKLAGDEAVRSAKGPHLIVRTAWVYAAEGKNFLRTILRLATHRKQLRVVDDQFGAPTSAQVVADALAGIVGSGGSPMVDRFSASDGIVNLTAAGETSWHGFAAAIVSGLRERGATLATETIMPISTKDYPTTAMRPANSRLDLTRLERVFGIFTPNWSQALSTELDHLEVAVTN